MFIAKGTTMLSWNRLAMQTVLQKLSVSAILFVIVASSTITTTIIVHGQTLDSRGKSRKVQSLDAAVKYALDVISRSDITTLRRISLGQVDLVNERRIPPSMLPGELRDQLIKEDFTRAVSDGGDSTCITVNSSLAVDLTKPLDTRALKAIKDFCSLVHSTVEERVDYHMSDRTSFGPNLSANDDFIMNGPAIQAPITSDVNWRIEFVNANNKWQIERLIVTEH